MPRSVASSEPLSSPTPTPSPPPRSQPAASTSKPPSTAAIAIGLESGSDLSDLTEDEEQEDDENVGKNTAQGTSRSRRGGGIVPAPMWDWAYKRTVSSSRSQSATRPAADTPDRRDSSASQKPDSQSASNIRIPSPSPERTTRARAKSDATLPPPRNDAKSDDEENGEEEDNAHVDDEKEEGEISEPSKSEINAPDDNSNPSDDEEPAADAEEPPKSTIIPTEPTRKSPIPPAASDTPNFLNEDEDGDEVDARSTASDASIDVEWASQVEPTRPHPAGDGSLDFSFLSRPFAIARSRLLARETRRQKGEDVDEPEFQEEIFLTRKLALKEQADATSGVVAGTPQLAGEAVPDQEGNIEVVDDGAVPNGMPPDGEPEIEEDVELEVDVEPEAEPAVDEEEEEEGDEIMEAETDLQPPQRAEALDILAGIEVKFAILRERIYLDKMEEIAQEEAMIREDTHPELLHFMATLSQRKERRITLTSRRREYDEDFAHKKRKADEDAVWSWWRVQKEELRDVMISETNGKRRRLEREKRSLESRSGVHRASPPTEVPAIGPRPIKQILRDQQRPAIVSSPTTARVNPPLLSILSEHEVNHDLDALQTQRRHLQRPSYNHANAYNASHPHTHAPHAHLHNQDAYGGVGGEYGVIDGSQYAGMPPPSSHNVVTSSTHHRQQLALPAPSPRLYPSSGSHHDAPPGFGVPSTSSSQQSRSYNSSQYAQQMPPNQMHITSAPVVPRKRSLSPSRSLVPPHVNGWEDGSRRSKAPRMAMMDVADGEEWVHESHRRAQISQPRNYHRAPSEPYGGYDGPHNIDRPPSNTSNRLPPEYPDRSYHTVSSGPTAQDILHGDVQPPNSSMFWGRREGSRRDESQYSSPYYMSGAPPSRPPSQPMRPPSPSLYRTSSGPSTLPPPPPSARRTPLPLGPGSPTTSAGAKKNVGLTSPMLSRLASAAASPAPPSVSQSQKVKASSPSMVPPFPLPPLPANASGNSGYGNGMSSLVFSSSPSSLPPNSVSGLNVNGGGSGSNGPSRTSSAQPPQSHPPAVSVE